MDKLEQVLSLIESRDYIKGQYTGWPIVSLISWKTLSKSHYESIRYFQKIVQEYYDVMLVVIGGGYGCSKILFSVEARTHEEASLFVLNIMESPSFRKLAVEAEFRVAISNDPYFRTDLRTGDQELSKEAVKAINKYYIRELNIVENKTSNNVTHIEGDVKKANLAIGSEGNTMQLNHQHKNSLITQLLYDIKTQLNENLQMSEIDKAEAIDIVDAIDIEAKKEKPKRALLKSYAESLKSISSIGGSVTKLLSALGLGG